MDPYNSSDDEDVLPPSAHPFANAGARAVKNIIDNKAEARKQSKIASKGLKLIYGAPSSQYHRQRASNLFYAFYTEALGHDKSRTPVWEDYERFLLDIPNRLEGRHENGAISESTFDTLRKGVLDVIEQAYPDFKVTKGHEARVKSIFHDLREKGSITRKPARERQWITSNVVFEMTTAIFQDAITKGTPSWSVTVGKAFSLAIISATAARAGDIARSHRYNDDYVLKWKDVIIKVSIDALGRPLFRCKITMRHTKSYKDDPSHNTVVTLESSETGCYNVMDPVTLAIVMALRTGATAATSIDDLVEATTARPDRTMQWAFPDRPVLCCIENGQDRHLVLDKPAYVTQINNTLKAAAANIGVTVKVTPHDLRRGTAQEAAALNKATGIDSAAQVLGHRPITTMTGLTQKYIGDMRAVDWERRTTLKDDLDWSLQTDGKRQKIAHRQGIFTPSSIMSGPEQAVVKLESNAENSLEAGTSNTNAESEPTDTLGHPDAEVSDSSLNYFAELLGDDSDDESLGIQPDAAPTETGRPTSDDFTAEDPMTFIRMASTINSSTTYDKRRLSGSLRPTTGSENPVEQFLLWCKYGCGRSAKSATQLAIHEAGCSPERRIIAKVPALKESNEDDPDMLKETLNAVKVVHCPREGCDKSYKGNNAQNSIAKHIREVHEYTKVRCRIEHCSDETLWDTYKKLSSHEATHSFPPRRCSRVNCNSRTAFKDKPALVAHLMGVHQVARKDANAIVMEETAALIVRIDDV
ncbi:hypothetical protein D6C80_05620 [Aureobasidium pullulans]|nr:hypothetical protein D6C80_05620 [Aureobasidium pullulans]